jgi:predicted negative regulator of RcsB-dependent stress response
MANTPILLSAEHEPTDEQLKKIMTDALHDVLISRKKSDEALKKQAASYKLLLANKHQHPKA